MGAENTEDQVQQQQTPPANQTETPPVSNANQEEGNQQERDSQGKFRNPLQPRIDELTRDKHDARREANYWKTRAEAAEQKANPPAPPPKKPEPADFDDYGAYVEALTEWKADEKVKARFDERDKATNASRQAESRASNWDKSVSAARSANADYDAVMEASDVPVANHVTELLLDSEHGATVALHLAKNESVARKLNSMTPTQAAREIGRLEAKLIPESAEPPAEGEGNGEQEAEEISQKNATPPPKPKTSAAPPPAKPGGQNRSTKVPLEKQSMDDYIATRKQQGARWAR